MEDQIMTTSGIPRPVTDAAERHRLFVCGLWLRGGFVGASAVAAGIVELANGEAQPAVARGLLVVGGLLAAYCWRRARSTLDVTEGLAVPASVASITSAAAAV